jgi:PleD family two-component response regulator
VESRVLLIEDNEANRDLLRDRLEANGMRVIEAETGNEGLEKAAQLLPQVVVLSSTLPDITGNEVAGRLRAHSRTSHIFLLVLADEKVHRDRLESLKRGADDFVAAPFDAEEVMLRVRNALRRADTNVLDPTTGLPSSQLIQEQLRRLLKDPEGEWAVLRVHVGGLDAVREGAGFRAAQLILRDIVEILSQALGEFDDFLGYSGSDTFIITIDDEERAGAVAQTITTRFNEDVLEGERPSSPVHLRIRRVTPADGPFYDIRSLSEALGG